MFGLGVHLQLQLRRKGFKSVPERTWRRWLDHPEERRGPIGELLERASGADSLKEIGTCFRQLRTAESGPFERDLKVMKICVSAAPLVGLLGTVTGMLATFGALSSGSGGDKTMGLVAEGISEALITTETGLIIALPGLFFQYQLVRQYERYKAFLAHLESVCAQALHRRLLACRPASPRPSPTYPTAPATRHGAAAR
jgi:biopolymer transport protein ExbB